MRTLSEEQFKKEYGASAVAKLDQIDDNRFSNTSNPPPNVMKRINQGAQGFTKAIGLGGATDVFGKLIARSSIGAALTGGNVEASREFIGAPSGKQIAGAAAQTAAIPAGVLLTGGTSLAGQVAAGAGLGYLYDVGADYAEGKTGAENWKPGAETIAGAAIPIALRGAGVGLRGLGSLGDKATTGVQKIAGEAVEGITDSIPTTGIGQRAREFAQRFPRAVRRVGEYVDEGAEIAQRKQTGSPAVVRALDEGLPVQTVDFVQQFDTPTRQSAKEMFELAEAGRGAALPQTVPGRIAGNQLDLVEQQRKTIGAQIGEFSDSLPTQSQDITPALQNLDSVLSQNGIIAQNGNLVFDNVAITPKQQGILQELYSLSTQRTEMSPRQIHQMDQLFSKLQREARFEGVDDVFVKVPTAEGTTDTNIYKVFRDVFGQKLDEIAEQAGRSDIRDLNREYRTLRNLTDNVESTIVRQSRLDGVNVDPSESASVALRRLFSNAQSKAEYQEIYDQLDATSRSLGYDGARADTLMDFYLTDMKPLYPDTVAPASFEGGIRGALSGFVDKVTSLGSPDVKDQREALKLLLEEAAEATE